MELDNIDALEDNRRVLIFYSSDEQPEILDFYEEAITYLSEIGIDREVIDIAEGGDQAERARKYDILTTPAVVVKKDGSTETYTGIMAGLKQLLQEDVYGKSVLHEAGFKRGRTLAEEALADGADEDEISEVLEEFFAPGAAVEVVSVDFDAQRAAVGIEPTDEDGSEGAVIHEQFAAVLEGFFMEVFGTNGASEETKCVREGDERCEFEIEGVQEGNTDANQGA